MGYQPSAGRTSSNRPRGFDRPKKAKTKKATTQHASGPRRVGTSAQSTKEVVDRTITGLETLGSQTFAMAPFNQHFDRWLKSLGSVLDDFETSKVIELDEKFREERASIVSAVEAALKAEQAKEASREANIMGIHASKDQLFHAEHEHGEKLREQATRRDTNLKELTSSVEALRAKLDEVLESKVGLLERFTKSKAKMEEDARSRLSDAEKGVEVVKDTFAEELAALQKKYEQEKGVILEKVIAERREIDKLVAEAEVDGSVEVRRVACEELAGAVKDLIQRAKTTDKTGED
jgi:hypothetical protein